MLEVGDDRGDQGRAGAKGVVEAPAPRREVRFALTKKALNQRLESLREAGVGDVAFSLVELAREEEGAAREDGRA